MCVMKPATFILYLAHHTISQFNKNAATWVYTLIGCIFLYWIMMREIFLAYDRDLLDTVPSGAIYFLIVYFFLFLSSYFGFFSISFFSFIIFLFTWLACAISFSKKISCDIKISMNEKFIEVGTNSWQKINIGLDPILEYHM